MSPYLQKATATTSKPFTCQVCRSTYSSLGSLKRHQQELHSGLYRYPCALCDKGYSTCDSLKAHLAKAHGVLGVRVSCDVCGASFSRRDVMLRHMRSTHVDSGAQGQMH